MSTEAQCSAKGMAAPLSVSWPAAGFSDSLIPIGGMLLVPEQLHSYP